VTTSTVLAGALANISGTYLGTTQSAALTIDIAVLSSVSMNPSSIAGGNASTGTVTLTGPAPTGGATVTLAADNPSVSALEGVYLRCRTAAGRRDRLVHPRSGIYLR